MSRNITMTACAVALAVSVMAVSGCKVDELYSLENIQNTDLTVTLFEDGLQLPLVESTAGIRVESLLSDAEADESISQYLKVDENGDYYLYYGGNYSLDEAIDGIGLSDILNISGVDFSTDFEYDLGGFNADDVKVEGIEFGQDITIDDFSGALEANIDQIKTEVKKNFGLINTDYSFTPSRTDVNVNTTLLTKSYIKSLSAAAEIAGKTNFPIPVDEVGIEIKPTHADPIEIPGQIKSIKSVTMSSDARVRVDLSIENCVLESGSVTPAITVDLSDILVFEDGSSKVDLSSLVLNKANGYTTSRNYKVVGLNADMLAKDKEVKYTGDLKISEAVASTAEAAKIEGDARLIIKISFESFEVKSAECEIKPVEKDFSQTAEISIGGITLPEQVKEIRSFTFTDDSRASIRIAADRLSKIKGLDVKVKDMAVEFPADMTISGEGVVGNRLIIPDASLAENILRDIRIEKVNIKAVGGKIDYNAEVKVTGNLVASGTIETETLPKSASEDVEFVAAVVTDIKVDDFDATINAISQDIKVAENSIKMELPDEIGDFGTFTIVPSGAPALKIAMTIPDLGTLNLSAGDGIDVKLPEFVEFASIPAGLKFNEDSHILTIPEIRTANYALPIRQLVVTPVKNAVTGKYEVSSSYSVSGVAGIASSKVDRATVDKISGAKISFNAELDDIQAGSISVDELAFDVNENVELDIMAAKDIPDMLMRVEEIMLTDVVADLRLDLSGLPDIGSGKFMVDLTADLPAFINPSKIELKGEIGSDGKFSKSVKILGFDLSKYDFPALKAEGKGLSDCISVAGRVYASNPTVDLDALSGKVKGGVSAKIADSEGQIGIRSLKAVVDYQIDSTFRVKMFDLGEFVPEGCSISLPDITASIDISSNLAIPLDASVQVFGVTGDKVSTDVLAELSLEMPYSEQGDIVVKNNAKTLNINRIINARCDSLEFRFIGNLDKSRCCYVETAADYTLNMDYEISAPFQLGKGTMISYADTLSIGDAGSVLAQVLGAGSAGISGKVENTLPFSVKVECEFLAYDEASGEYRVVPMGRPLVSDIVKAGDTSDLNIVIQAGSDTSDYRNISHLRINASLGSDGSTLSKSDYIKVTNLALIVPKGITIDPDMFTNNNENK